MQEILNNEVVMDDEERESIDTARVSFLIGYYDYTVVLTYLGMLTGFIGIALAMAGKFDRAVLCLMVSGVCDMFDGAVASTKMRTKKEKRFGVQIDSFSDLLCFGVLPAVITFGMVHRRVIGMTICGLYVLCALIRLAYFNVDEEERQDKTNERRTWYLGVPVTTIALIYPIFFNFFAGVGKFLALLIVMGMAFLLPVKIRKPHIFGKTLMCIIGLLTLIQLVSGMIIL